MIEGRGAKNMNTVTVLIYIQMIDNDDIFLPNIISETAKSEI